jgi:hypothetical protein
VVRTLTFDELVAALGDPRPYMTEDGQISREWELDILGIAHFPAPLPLSWDRTKLVTKFRCHKRLIPLFETALGMIHTRPDVWATIDDFGGCYNWRTVRGSKRVLSAHAFGAAIDLDVRDNPMGRRKGRSMVDPYVVECSEAQGFFWGGRFGGERFDPQHFEFIADLTLSGGVPHVPEG